MTWLADAALWAVIALTGIVAGVLASWIRKNGRAAIFDPLILGAAAAAVASLCARAGQVLGGPTTSQWVTASVPVDASPLSRVATLWATLPGATLMSATILLVWLAVSAHSRSGSPGTRHSLVVAIAALCLSATSAWFQPGPSPTASVPPFAQHPTASLAALSALVSITVLGWALSAGLAHRQASTTQLYLGWLLSTLAVAFEQVARSSTGIGPRDAISLGSASSALLLWLVASGLLHNGIQRRLFGTVKASRSQIVTLAAHVGAGCVVVSFALHAVASRANVVLPPGQPVSVTDAFGKEWKLVNQGVSQFDDEAAEVTSLTVEVNSPRGATTLLTPEIREFHAPDGQHLADGVLRRRSTPGAMQTVRILFTGADSLDAGSVRVTFLPAPILWNAGIVLLVLAALAGLSSRQTVTHRNS